MASNYERILKPLLFRLDPERVHNAALRLVAWGLVRTRLLIDPRLQVDALGVRFGNPLGLAAGFDKNGVAVDRWQGLGFGFAEMGTVTALAQPGNPRPRMFRLPSHHAIINRLGFNNAGAEALAARLRARRTPLPIGVNIGKSKATPLDRAPEDYVASLRALAGLAQYVVVNVSSPNTPGLRGLQEKGPLMEVLGALREAGSGEPLLVKVAPDLGPAQLDDVLEVVEACDLAGIVATNTTLARPGMELSPPIEGGLSGAPLRPLADEALAYLAKGAKGRTLIGVGGIFTGEDVLRKLELGASLAQVYTGWVYRGPGGAPAILAELLAAMERRGLDRLPTPRARATG